MHEWYKDDLAYIHDVGHSNYALRSAPGILDILRNHHIHSGLIVDLGCGSGWSALKFTGAGYQVIGVDISESLIAIAKNKVPQAEFQVCSILKYHLPACNVVTSIGECFNYLFDPDNTIQSLSQYFKQVYTALVPGGLFIFDIAEPGQIPQGEIRKNFREGQDWVVLVDAREDWERARLTRRIMTFRKVGERYRRSDEVHDLQLYQSAEIAKKLCQQGFQVHIIQSYGSFKLPNAHAGFIAKKPF